MMRVWGADPLDDGKVLVLDGGPDPGDECRSSPPTQSLKSPPTPNLPAHFDDQTGAETHEALDPRAVEIFSDRDRRSGDGGGAAKGLSGNKSYKDAQEF
ncbi:MAG: hypothetical protein ACI9MB_004030 [Verrucomicrobiales bacterium]|jgi:hypothetical protein